MPPRTQLFPERDSLLLQIEGAKAERAKGDPSAPIISSDIFFFLAGAQLSQSLSRLSNFAFIFPHCTGNIIPFEQDVRGVGGEFYYVSLPPALSSDPEHPFSKNT